MRWRTTRPVSVDEENPYWMSFSDIMSALLVIFILAAVILILQLMEKQKEIDERQVKFAPLSPEGYCALEISSGASHNRWRFSSITRLALRITSPLVR